MSRALTLLALVLAGCVKPTIAPSDDDPHARSEIHMTRTEPERPPCKRDVEVLKKSAVTRFHERIAEVSVTCAPYEKGACRDKLVHRACELEADALLLSDADFTGPPEGVGNPRSRSLGGVAVRWKKEATLTPREKRMVEVCKEIAGAITDNAGKCTEMGAALSTVFEPNLELIEAYQASAVSKTKDRPFAGAEDSCNTALPVETLKTFWACKDDPEVHHAFERMNALKP